MKKFSCIMLFFFGLMLNRVQAQRDEYTLRDVSMHTKKLTKKVAELNNLNEGNGFEYHIADAITVFCRDAKIRECLVLVNHPNPTVRYVSFIKLSIEKYPSLDKILGEHSKDSALIHYSEFCRGYSISVFEMMTRACDENKELSKEELEYKYRIKERPRITAEDHFNYALDIIDDIQQMEDDMSPLYRKALKKAGPELLKAIELDSTVSDYYRTLAYVNGSAGNFDEAIKYYNLALKRGAFVYRDIAWLKMDQNRPAEALAYLDQGILFDSLCAACYSDRADVRKILHDTIGFFSDSVIADDLTLGIDGLFSRGASRVDREVPGAIDDLNKAISKNDTVNWLHYYYRAKAKNLTGDYSGALADCDTVLKYEKRFNNIRRVIAKADAGLGKYTDAIAVYSAVKVDYPDDKLMDADIGEVYYLMKDYEKALEYYDSALEQIKKEEPSKARFKKDDDWSYIRGDIYLKLGKMEEACSNWNYSQSPEAKKALKQYCEK
ncbi:MAG: tetratricopeptide repeat protein [Bacteroidia bacterium]